MVENRRIAIVLDVFVICRTIPTIVRLFKSATTRRINVLRGTPGLPVWQRNDYERIIRNESSLNRIRRYIAENPSRWGWDRENPDAAGPLNTRQFL